ncbi:hypothetical protein PWY87_35100 [Kribbella solani]|uniref:hypothetical protein n=1 Tax=Kribbella solani TaxID=236067 RepID=UPI0029BAC5B2|nr:hypothetical protein [Kribbella solani]MDX2972612.1 hypothetical protein [Kribbella solani]MDX3006942.1 hypothetical protein [Kribbella solani]
MDVRSAEPTTDELLEITLAATEMLNFVLLLQARKLANSATSGPTGPGDYLDERIAAAAAPLERHARRMTAIFTDHQAWINQHLRSELQANTGLAPGDRSNAEQVLARRNEDYAQGVIDAMRRVVGDAPATYSREVVACDLLVGVVGGGLMTCFKTVGTGCLVAGMGAGLALALC